MHNHETASLQKWLGIGLIWASGLIHLIAGPAILQEVRYIGLLFVASVVGALLAAFGIALGERWGWVLGILVAVGSIAGYLLSRSVGLPGFRVNSWEAFIEPLGLLSLLVEGLFLVVAARALTGRAGSRKPMTV